MDKVSCPHGCKCLLVKDKKKGSFKCPKCGCIFRVVLVRWNVKCFQKHHPKYHAVTLKEVRKTKRKRRIKK